MLRSYWIRTLLLGTVVCLTIALIYVNMENSLLKKQMREILKENAKFVLKTNVERYVPLSNSDKMTAKLTKNFAKKVPRKFDQTGLTIVLFKHNDSFQSANENSFNSEVQKLSKQFPATKILWNKEKQRLGTALNSMISQVESGYFLFVEPEILLSERQKESIEFLWDALEEFPELDFVGGSYLSGDKLYVQCHRFRLCRWTFSESYEYKMSLDNLMICDGTSSSFMGRLDSVKKIQGFDETIPDLMVVKEFFLRAKANNTVVGTKPNVVFITENYRSLYELWNSGDISKELVPFAAKHKVLKFKDTEGKIFDICDAKSPLSGKDLCIETNTHKIMLGGAHWAYTGIYAYPFILDYLKVTLSEVSDFFNRQNVSHSVYGGIALGAIKMHSILPWEAGDIDIAVYGLTLDELYKLLTPFARKNGYALIKTPEQVNIFCTPKHVGELQGGIATIFAKGGKPLPKSELIRVQTSGIWVSYKRDLIHGLMGEYGKGYLLHKTYRSSEVARCSFEGHHACLPNFRKLLGGKSGTLREFFCQE